MVADYGVFKYQLAEQTILNRMYAQQDMRPKAVEPLSALYNCPTGHCTQSGGASPPCLISHHRSHAQEVSLGLAGKRARAKPIKGTASSMPPPCVDFAKFRARRRHSSALLMGNGPSANVVTAAQARIIERTWDVWATNAFFVHAALTPDFHHVEIKGYTEPFWLANFDAAVRARYRAHGTLLWGFEETKFVAVRPRPNDCRLTALPKRNASAARSSGHVCGSNCPRCLRRVLRHTRLSSYTYYDLAFGETPIDFGRCAHGPITPNVLSKRCHASIVTVLSMIIQLRYETLYILGVDLNSPLHFFDVKPKYAKLHRPDLTREERVVLAQTAKSQSAQAKTATQPQHRTARLMVAFLPPFLAANGLSAVNLSPDSLLRSTSIPFLGLTEALDAR